MTSTKILTTLTAATMAMAMLLPGQATAAFPEKPVTFVVPFGAGGGFDRIARKVAEGMSKSLKVPVPIKNVPGAGGRRGSIELYKSKPDGYTIGFAHFVPLQSDEVLLGKKPAIDYRKFSVILQVSHSRHFIFVRNDLPFKSVADLKGAGKTVKFSGTGVGAITWVEGHALGAAVGFPVRFVTGFKSLPEAALAVAKGDADAGVGGSHHFRGVVKDVRPIVFLGEKRDSHFPNVPTIIEAGYPDLAVLGSPRVVVAPPGAPSDRLGVLRAAVRSVVGDPAFVKWAGEAGYYLNPKSPAELEKVLATNADIYKGLNPLIKKATGK